ncbi:MAG: hypothetical protein AB1489_32045 [Acidobacteriota bacterium]
MKVERIIKVTSYYAGIFDLYSSANKIDLIKTLMNKANAEAIKANNESSTLYYFNHYLKELGENNELLSWVLLFEGVYKIQAEVRSLADGSILNKSQHFLGDSNVLKCPSGKIAVASLGSLGSQYLNPIIVVDPGVYRINININEMEEQKHDFLEDIDEYPQNDGPDWIIQIERSK